MKEVNTVEQTSTVAAIATPNAAGGIGIVRISGGDAIAVADKVFSAVSGKPLSEAAGYSAHFGTVSFDGKPIDEAIALVFRAPKSYTGEDTVELSCHGGVYIVRQVLRAVLNAGAQPAGPGEFTKRAFLNGRIDLAKAESVMSLISAQGEQAASAAFNTLEGRLSGRIESVARSIINVCAHLSAWVDYPDEDIEELSTDELEKTFDGEIDFTHPQGGLFLWGTMKSGMDSSEFFRKAISEKVAVVDGKTFMPTPGECHSFRLNYSTPSDEQIVEGVRRLYRAYHK